jgi:hypothetical protein
VSHWVFPFVVNARDDVAAETQQWQSVALGVFKEERQPIGWREELELW